MKKEDLFQGAIVLARKYAFKKRARCKIIDVGRSHSVVQDQRGYKFVTEQKDLRPAKITPKSLIGLGFKSKVTYCNLYGVNRSEKGAFCLQYIYNGPEDIRIALKGGCKLWSSNVMFDDRCNISKMHSVSYIHQVQKIINQQK